MGKLVLGILFVILLQVVFFGYTSRFWSTPNETILAKSHPKLPQSRADIPPTIPPAADIVEPPVSPQSDKTEVTAPAREVVRSKAVAVAVNRTRTTRVREGRNPVVRDSALIRHRPENEQLSAIVPTRYTVVVTDNLRPSIDTKTADISKPKKRSFLAKSFSVVVKKPWNWMKSLASKLD